MGGCHLSWAMGKPAKDLDFYVNTLDVSKVSAALINATPTFWRGAPAYSQKHIEGILEYDDSGVTVQIIRSSLPNPINNATCFDFHANMGWWRARNGAIDSYDYHATWAAQNKKLVLNVQRCLNAHVTPDAYIQTMKHRVPHMQQKCPGFELVWG